MKRIGSYMVFFGVFAIILNFFNAVPALLGWIYNWGDTAAWGIKIAFILIGGLLWFFGNKAENTQNVN